MADARGFLKFGREKTHYRPVAARLQDYACVQEDFAPEKTKEQAARCMDCGVPFCNNGCPLGNIIPDFNDLVFRDKWEDALARLHSTNNFPEFTGMVCPAPCEQACVLGINQEPVAIKQVEWEIVRRGWDEGWIQPLRPARRTGRSVAVIGSGPAGLSAAQQLTRAGHTVTLFEKADRVGGLLRYGIPDFKLEKWVIDRRLEQLREEGVAFQTGVHVGVDYSVADLRKNFDAVLLCVGAEKARDLEVPGRELAGVHFAMEFLPQQNRRVAGDSVPQDEAILATGKHVVILGGGDTGSDCIGTSHRHGAKSVTSIELLPQPPEGRHTSEPWPSAKKYYFNVSSSHLEGGERTYAIATKRLTGKGGRVEKLHAVRVEFDRDGLDRPLMNTLREVGPEFEIAADLVLLAMGFVGPTQDELV
ncbi:MAG: glutamate synthase subunit beta, partial [Myxococcota bacterium]